MKIFAKNLIKKILKNFGWKLVKINRRPPESYTQPQPSKELFDTLLSSSGILHLGAHRGTEAENYNWLNKRVIWIEANEEIFEDLKDNVRNYYNQKAYCYLLGDKNCIHDFYISSNDAASSSVYDFSKEVKDKNLWKNIKMVKKIKKKMTILDEIINDNNINIENYDHWNLDLQGAELKCLLGATNSLKFCKSIFIEISKKKYYEGGILWEDLKDFLIKKNFKLITHPKEDHTEVLFKRNFF